MALFYSKKLVVIDDKVKIKSKNHSRLYTFLLAGYEDVFVFYEYC